MVNYINMAIRFANERQPTSINIKKKQNISLYRLLLSLLIEYSIILTTRYMGQTNSPFKLY